MKDISYGANNFFCRSSNGRNFKVRCILFNKTRYFSYHNMMTIIETNLTNYNTMNATKFKNLDNYAK